MSSVRIVQVTDLHLSRDYPVFVLNWEVLAERIRAVEPDLVLVTGDLALADPDRHDDLVFARERLDALELEWLAIPGNHDIGENHRDDLALGSHPQKAVDMDRRSRFLPLFGPDWWRRPLGDWLLVGVNAQLFGARLPVADEQRDFLAATLEEHQGDAVMLVTHKPLYSREEGADEPGWSVPSEETAWIERLLAPFPRKVCVSGHLHRHKRYLQNGIDCIWAPSTAFFSSHPRIAKRRGMQTVGALEIGLGPEDVTIELIDDDRLLNHDARNWFNPDANALDRILAMPRPFP